MNTQHSRNPRGLSLRHVTLRQLKVFESVARHLSYSRAADELGLTQPAVSMQIKALVEQVGLPLFDQIGRKISLTDAGHELYRHAHEVARQLGAAEEALATLKGLAGGKLDIAVVSTAKYFAPQLLARFLKDHPGVQLKLSVNNREVVMRQLAENETDLAITGRPPQRMETVAEAFAPHPHVIIAPPEHPLAGKRGIPLTRLAAETFVVREPGSGTRGLLERLFSENQVPLNMSLEMASNETIKQAVMAGMGISLLSLHTIGLELETGRLVALDVKGTPIERHWHVVHLQHKHLSPVARAFKDYLLAAGGPFLARFARLR